MPVALFRPSSHCSRLLYRVHAPSVAPLLKCASTAPGATHTWLAGFALLPVLWHTATFPSPQRASTTGTVTLACAKHPCGLTACTVKLKLPALVGVKLVTAPLVVDKPAAGLHAYSALPPALSLAVKLTLCGP